ncbi:MAG: FtsX-like permease family protein [Candidatus Hodarchaeota archaeon]
MINVKSSYKQLLWILKFISRDVRKHKLRTVIGIVSIGLSIGLLVAMNATVDTLSKSYVDLILNTAQDYDFEINPSEGLFIENYSNLISQFYDMDEIENATPRYVSQAFMRIRYESENLIDIPANLIGLDVDKENELHIGSFDPEINEPIGINQCLLIGNFGKNVKTALNTNLSINHFFINFQSPSGITQEHKLEISKVVEDDQRLPPGFNLVVVDLSLIESWLEIDEICTTVIGKFQDTSIYSAIDPESSVQKAQQIAIKIQSKIGLDYSVALPKATAIEAADFSGIRLILNFIGILILILATLLIYSLNTISIEEKNREYGMLRTLGVKDSKIMIMLFLSQLFSVFWGVIVGLGLGYIFTMFISNLLLSSLEEYSITITANTIIFSSLVGVLAGFFSAIKPSTSLINRNIVLSLEVGRHHDQEYSIKRERQVSKSMGLSGLAIASVGSVFFVIFPLLDIIDDQNLLMIFFLGLLLSFLIGAVLLAIGVFSPIFEGILVKILTLSRKTRKIGVMTRTFLKKNARRNSLTATIFALSLAFILWLSTSNSLQSYMMTENLRHYYGSDIVIQSSGVIGDCVNPSVISYIKNHENVSAVSYTSAGSISFLIGCQVSLGDMALFNSISPSGIYAIPDLNFSNSLYTSPLVSKNAWVNLVDTNNTIVISRAIANRLNLQINKSIRMKIHSPVKNNNEHYGKNLNLTVVGIADRIPGFNDVRIASKYADYSAVFVGNTTWNMIVKHNSLNMSDQISVDTRIDRVFIKCVKDDSETIESVQTELFLEYGTAIQTIRIDTLLDMLRAQQENSRETLSVILSLSFIIAFFSIFSSTQTSIIEAISEIGIIKALGLKERELVLVFISQALILTLVSSLLGGVVGYSLAYIQWAQGALLAEFPLVIISPDPIIPIIYIVALLLSVVGTYLPVRSLKNKEPSEILRTL